MLNVIVPSAVKVSPEMEVDFGPIPPCLIPIGGKVVADKIVEQYGPETQFYFALNDGKELVQEHFDFFPSDRVHLVDVGRTISIGHTIHKVIELCPELVEAPLVIHFADTIVENGGLEDAKPDFIAVADTIESERWTLIKEEGGRITDLSDKEFMLDSEGWRTLLGVWGFADPGLFRELLAAKSPATNKSSFYESMVEYYNGLPAPPQFVLCPEFIDCGHADNYYSARRKYINARFFNQLRVDDRIGTIRKSSENTQKLIDEISWMQSLPKELKPYLPTIFDYSKDPLNPFIEMEFYSYPSLDEAFVSARYDFDTWEKLFIKLFELLGRASKYRAFGDDLATDLDDMYRQKTIGRLEMASLPALSNSTLINGVETPGLSEVSSTLRQSLESKGASTADSFQVIHGDLCLGNILYDPRHGLIKLVDPRGRFGRFDIYGDVYYDLAKLSHSVLGHYDFIVSGRARAVEADSAFTLKFKTSDYHHTVGEIFIKNLSKHGFDLAKVRLIESLLFLSMIPLHKDRPDRQLAMALQGLQLYSKFGAAG